MHDNHHQSSRFGIVLAGGEGKRLKSFVQRWTGSDLPKQYVAFMGGNSMLEKTFVRAERVIPRKHIFTVIDRKHLAYPEVSRQLDDRPEHTVVFQPQNKETAAGLLLPLVHLLKRHPHAYVAVLPSDHHFANDDRFRASLEMAFTIAEADPSRMVLLGVRASHLEPEYGYILPGDRIHQDIEHLYTVECFVEKPAKAAAEEIMMEGGVWNTRVMVFQAQTFLNAIKEVLPTLFEMFLTIYTSIGTPQEMEVTQHAYAGLEPLNLSTDFLQSSTLKQTLPLTVLLAQDIGWTDLGSEARISAILKQEDCLSVC